MTTSADSRPLGLRVLLALGLVLLVAIGLPLAGVGLLGIGTGRGRALLCAGLVLLVTAAGGAAREVVERRVRRHPPQPVLSDVDGEQALHLPRDPGATRVSTWTLTGLAAVALVSAVFAGAEAAWGWSAALVVVGVLLGWSSGVLRGGAPGGGLWLTPTRFVHVDRGFRVEVAWDGLTGVVPQQPMPVLVHPDRTPTLTRTGPSGRAWKPVGKDGTMLVDTAHLAGGAEVAAYVIGRAITDPRTRTLLGTADSLPPAWRG